jgi:hypothetical protein
MDITKEELAAQYVKLADHELLRRIRSGTMTTLGFEAACEELRSRGVEIESTEGPARSQEPDSTVDALAEQDETGIDFLTIAHLVNPVRANLLRSHLQSEGIVVHVLGEHLGVVNMLLSSYTGGIRVQVRNDQVKRAQEILAEFDRIEQTVAEPFDEDNDELQSPEGGAVKRYSSERASPYAPPKSRVADVQLAKRRRESLNRPTTPRFFWMITLIAAAVVFFALATS